MTTPGRRCLGCGHVETKSVEGGRCANCGGSRSVPYDPDPAPVYRQTVPPPNDKGEAPAPPVAKVPERPEAHALCAECGRWAPVPGSVYCPVCRTRRGMKRRR